MHPLDCQKKTWVFTAQQRFDLPITYLQEECARTQKPIKGGCHEMVRIFDPPILSANAGLRIHRIATTAASCTLVLCRIGPLASTLLVEFRRVYWGGALLKTVAGNQLTT